jgi:Yip1 domain
MNLVNRAKNMILSPKTEWDVAAAEPTPPAQVVTGYVLPLAAAYALASFIGTALIASFIGGAAGIGFALVAAIYHLVMAVVMVFVMGFIIDALAPTFAGTKNFNQAVKVSAYAYTPVWVFGLLTIIPFLGWLAVLVGVIYSLYLLYLGLPRLMRSPEDKSVPYVVVIIVCAIVLGILVSMVGGLFGMGMGAGMGRHMMGAGSAAAVGSSGNAKLDEFARKMEEANRRMEAAQKSGDSKAQAEAAMAALGTAISGGKGVDPVSIDQLKPFVPEKIAGLPRTDLRTERAGVKGLMTAKAEASYANGDRNVTLEIVDTGGAAGLMTAASWMGVQGEREDAHHREATRKEGSRLVHEEQDKQGGSSKYLVVLSDRFVVSAQGNGVDVATLKSAVQDVNLSGLEALK